MIRRTKIVATIGPASSSPEMLEALIRAGMDVARLNFSHGTHDDHARAITAIRSISALLDRPVAILQDLSGPKIRTGALRGGEPVTLVDGAELDVTTRPVEGDATLISTSYPHLPQDVRPGDRILLADGLMELRVLAVDGDTVRTEVVHGGQLGEHKGMNLPGVAALHACRHARRTRTTWSSASRHGVDYVAVSFVRQRRGPAAGEAAAARAPRRHAGHRQDREAGGHREPGRPSWAPATA